MSLAEIYPERHRHHIDTGLVRIIAGPEKLTAIVRNAGVMGIGHGITKSAAIAQAWLDAGRPEVKPNE